MLNVASRYCEIAVTKISNSQCFMTKRASHDIQLNRIKAQILQANYTTEKKGLMFEGLHSLTRTQRL